MTRKLTETSYGSLYGMELNGIERVVSFEKSSESSYASCEVDANYAGELDNLNISDLFEVMGSAGLRHTGDKEGVEYGFNDVLLEQLAGQPLGEGKLPPVWVGLNGRIVNLEVFRGLIDRLSGSHMVYVGRILSVVVPFVENSQSYSA